MPTYNTDNNKFQMITAYLNKSFPTIPQLFPILVILHCVPFSLSIRNKNPLLFLKWKAALFAEGQIKA